MGCQQLCQTQSSEIDNNSLITEAAAKRNNTNTVKTRNPVKKASNNNEYSIKQSLCIEETEVSNNTFKFSIVASNIHKMIPIWLEQGNSINFKVSGQWGFEENNELFDSYGCDNFEEKPNDKTFGCLLGYIPGDTYFIVFDELEYKPKISGPLYLFQNNGLFSVNPKGQLDLEITGATPMNIYEIERKLGWDLKTINTSIPEMKEEEITLICLINKARTNPKLFVKQFLNTNNPNEAELIQELNEMIPINPLKTDNVLYNVSKNHAIDLGNSEMVGHISSNGMGIEDRLKGNLIMSNIFAENCIFGYNDPLEIVTRLLIDEDNEDRNQRKIILSKEFNKVGISIQRHKGEFVWSCIQDFIYDDTE
jgi:hypothetical protein